MQSGGAGLFRAARLLSAYLFLKFSWKFVLRCCFPQRHLHLQLLPSAAPLGLSSTTKTINASGQLLLPSAPF
eukprot:1161685-Pelagomonas_calceolata.AAC.3